MPRQARPKATFSRAPRKTAPDTIRSPDPPTTAQGLSTQPTKTPRLKAASPSTMASPVDETPAGQADGAQHSPRAVNSTFQNPGIPDPPGHHGGRPATHIRLLEGLRQRMKDDVDVMTEAVLDDLREPIRKSIEERSQSRMWTFLEQHGEEIVQSLREEQIPLIRAELSRDYVPREVAVQVDAEFAVQRERKLAELAELDAQIERRKRSAAPLRATTHEQDDQPSSPVRIKIEQDDQPSNPVRIKIEEDDQPSSPARIKIEQDDQPSSPVHIKIEPTDGPSEAAGHPGTIDDDRIYLNLPELDEPDLEDLDEHGLPEENAVDHSVIDNDWSDREETLGDMYKAEKRCQSLPSDTDATEFEHFKRFDDEMRSGNPRIHGIRGYRILSPERFLEKSGESKNDSHQQDDASDDQHSNPSRQEGDTYDGQEEDYSIRTPGVPSKTDTLNLAHDADDERPRSKTRKSKAARGKKRKQETAFEDLADPTTENSPFKRAKINEKGLFESKADRDVSGSNINGLADSQADTLAKRGDHDFHKDLVDATNPETLAAAGDVEKGSETKLKVSKRKTKAVQTGRVKKSMPKKISRRSLRSGRKVQIKEEEEDDEEL